MIHELKTWPVYFDMVASGKKTWEIRKNDRDFRAGDILILKEYDNKKSEYTGKSLKFEVTYLVSGLPWLQEGYVIMTINPIK